MKSGKFLGLGLGFAVSLACASIVCWARDRVTGDSLPSETEEVPFSFAGTKNILFVFDASQSMLTIFETFDRNKHQLKIDREKLLLEDLLMQVPAEVNCGLRVFGGKELDQFQSCRETELVVPVGKNSNDKIISAVKNIQCAGLSPIEYTLSQAFDNDLRSVQGRTVVMLMTDGVDSCGGEPCRFAASLPGNRLRANIAIILFNDRRHHLTPLKIDCLAKASVGKLYDRDSFNKLLKDFQLISSHVR
jgi:hypothetical protein